MSALFIALVFVLGLVIGCASTALYYQRRALEARVAELEKQNEKALAANRDHLPFKTAEEIENATAAFILLQHELDFKQSLMDNLGAHLRKARENKRVSP